MNESIPQRPPYDDRESWKQYWAAIQPREWFKFWGYWRTEPEIPLERQVLLTRQRTVTPNIQEGIYPFKDIELNRADIEWLLATHESVGVIGPVNWSEDRYRIGLDLRGVSLAPILTSDG